MRTRTIPHRKPNKSMTGDELLKKAVLGSHNEKTKSTADLLTQIARN